MTSGQVDFLVILGLLCGALLVGLCWWSDRRLTLSMYSYIIAYMENTYSIGVAAKRIGVTVHTLQRWDRNGTLIACRSLTNQRFYTDEQIANAQGISGTGSENSEQDATRS